MAAPTTSEQAALEVMAVLAGAIKTLGSVPAGHLYGQAMGHLTHAQFETAIGALVAVGFVRRSNNLLTWVGKAES